MKIKFPNKFLETNKNKGIELFLQGLGETHDQIDLFVCGFIPDQERILDFEKRHWSLSTEPFYFQLNRGIISIPNQIIKNFNFTKSHINNPIIDRIYIWNQTYMDRIIERETKMTEREKEKRYQGFMNTLNKAGIQLPF